MTCTNCGNTVPEAMKFCPKCGTPMTDSRYAPPVNPAPSAWQSNALPPPTKRKSRTGKILLIVGIVLVLLVSGIGVAIYFGVSSYIRSTKSSAAYTLAESTLRSSQDVKDRLGELKNIGVPIGTFKEEADGTGFAVFFMSVEGEKASGQYVVEMTRRNSTWQILNAVVKLQNGEEIKVVDFKDEILSDPPRDTESDVTENQNTGTANSNNSNQTSKTISGGVLNGKATSLPKPPYPAVARSARAEGTVIVQVLVDEEGKVISANAVSGHPLLKASAVAAARQARFTPTKLAGKPVKVSGVINYNFKLEP
jgi:TonB family protein